MDIKLNELFELTASKTGDAPITINEQEALLQDIRLESMTQEGELFYDEAYGWSLLDFIQRQNDELDLIELEDRVGKKLARRPEIDKQRIQVQIIQNEDGVIIHIRFGLLSGEEYFMDVDLNRVEVIWND